MFAAGEEGRRGGSGELGEWVLYGGLLLYGVVGWLSCVGPIFAEPHCWVLDIGSFL